MTNLLLSWMESPTAQVFLNATSVLLKNTEVVWRPLLNMSVAMFGPFKGLVLSTARFALRTLALTILNVLWLVDTVANATSSFVLATKDFTVSLGTVLKTVGSLFVSLVHGVSYVIQTFEDVNRFLYRALFEAHTISWEDLYNISIPFLVVACILTYLTYRVKRTLMPEAEKTEEVPFVPRRSSRIAQKRAMLLSNDLASLAPTCKKTA